eukprot:587955-Rhodomonas_salina.2
MCFLFKDSPPPCQPTSQRTSGAGWERPEPEKSARSVSEGEWHSCSGCPWGVDDCQCQSRPGSPTHNGRRRAKNEW